MKTKQLTSSNRSHNTYNTDAACTVGVLLLLRYRMIKGRLKSKSTFIPAPLNTCLVEKHSDFIHPAGFPRRHHTPLCRNRGNSPASSVIGVSHCTAQTTVKCNPLRESGVIHKGKTPLHTTTTHTTTLHTQCNSETVTRTDTTH
jgi:hypothetical protein